MAKKKLFHFEEVKSFPHFFQPNYDELKDGYSLKGKWNTFFGNDNPITLEVGAGKAEFSFYLANKYPDRNFIAIDLKGARLWRGAKDSLDLGLKNIAFIRTHVQQVTNLFAAQEIQEIWIPFPDPQPRQARERKRLTSPHLLNRFKMILSDDHLIHLKTDNRGLYDYTLDIMKQLDHTVHFNTDLLYESNYDGDVKSVQTFYEKQFLAQGSPIHYIQFSLKH